MWRIGYKNVAQTYRMCRAIARSESANTRLWSDHYRSMIALRKRVETGFVLDGGWHACRAVPRDHLRARDEERDRPCPAGPARAATRSDLSSRLVASRFRSGTTATRHR